MTFTSSFLPAAALGKPSERDAGVVKVEQAPCTAVAEHLVGQSFLHGVVVFFIAALCAHAAVLPSATEVAAVSLHELIAHGSHQLSATGVLAHLPLLIDRHALLHIAEAGIAGTSGLVAAGFLIPTIHNALRLLEVIDAP